MLKATAKTYLTTKTACFFCWTLFVKNETFSNWVLFTNYGQNKCSLNLYLFPKSEYLSKVKLLYIKQKRLPGNREALRVYALFRLCLYVSFSLTKACMQIVFASHHRGVTILFTFKFCQL